MDTAMVAKRTFSFQELKCGATCADESLLRLKENGKKLNEILNINQDDIRLAIKEARKDWK